MIEFISKKIKKDPGETLIKKHFQIDTHIEGFCIIGSKDEKFSDALSHKIIDTMIDRIGTENTYQDFSAALENINSFIQTWKQESQHTGNHHVIISLLNKNNFLFSTLGQASCYLINKQRDVIEITDHSKQPVLFDYISQGDIHAGDIIVSSNARLLSYIPKSDFTNSLQVDSFEGFGDNMKDILESEVSEKSICITGLRNTIDTTLPSIQDHAYMKIAKQYLMRGLDNALTKKLIGILMIAKEKIGIEQQVTKNILIISAICICIIVLYSIISALLVSSTQDSIKDDAKLQLGQAIEYKTIANNNIANPEIFEQNIALAEKIVQDIKSRELYMNDINKITSDINALKKQYNGVETFDETQENLIYKKSDQEDPVKVLGKSAKLFMVNKKSITGPILPGQDPKQIVFDALEADEVFVDATVLGNDIMLLTNFSKVVKFTKDAYFSFQDVKDQVTWDQAHSIYSFGNNSIYFISEDKKQIKKHSKNITGFNAGQDYLKPEDSIQIGPILSIGIDGGIYILKQDMSMLKLFAAPSYRLQSLILNKLPKNYGFAEGNIDIKTAANLNYVYMLLDNKIWIFKTDARRYQDTKSLTYLGQIEGENYNVIDFYVKNDGEIYIINDDGIYKMKFEESDGKIIIR